MRYMGIDFGTKNVGIALSDEAGNFAMPHSVIKNSKNLVEDVKKIIDTEKVEHIVIGESKNYHNEENKIMAYVYAFKTELEKVIPIPISFEQELMTSREAQHIQGDHALLDASAAALILKSYLDRQNNG